MNVHGGVLLYNCHYYLLRSQALHICVGKEMMQVLMEIIDIGVNCDLDKLYRVVWCWQTHRYVPYSPTQIQPTSCGTQRQNKMLAQCSPWCRCVCCSVLHNSYQQCYPLCHKLQEETGGDTVIIPIIITSHQCFQIWCHFLLMTLWYLPIQCIKWTYRQSQEHGYNYLYVSEVIGTQYARLRLLH